VVALALAFAAYNLGLPLTLRSAFYPVLGKAVWGRFGHLIDVLAVFAALFGLATSLGLGAEQTAAGLAHLFGVPATTTTKVLIIAFVTFIAIASVVAGMDRGVKRLSQANLLLAMLLLAFVLTVGPDIRVLTLRLLEVPSGTNIMQVPYDLYAVGGVLILLPLVPLLFRVQKQLVTGITFGAVKE
jgi:BCCT family betaine/carnitine transporter